MKTYQQPNTSTVALSADMCQKFTTSLQVASPTGADYKPM